MTDHTNVPVTLEDLQRQAWEWGYQDATEGKSLLAGRDYYVGDLLERYEYGWASAWSEMKAQIALERDEAEEAIHGWRA